MPVTTINIVTIKALNNASDKSRKKRVAESLLEVIVSIFVIALGSAAATGLVTSALQSNALSRDNLTALNLATEGIEAVRNIRDSNWIKYAYDKQNCWNMQATKDECKTDNVIKGGYYTLSLDVSTMKWSLKQQETYLDLKDDARSSNNSRYQLVYMDVDTAVDSDGDGDPSNDNDMLVAASNGLTRLSKFYRMITITYPTAMGGPGDPTSSSAMTVMSLVQWKDRGIVHETKLVSKLTNYQKPKVK